MDKRGRRSVVTGLGATAAMAIAAARPSAQAAPVATAFQPARHDKDAWMDRVPGKHRMILDVTTASGTGEAIGFANNLFAANSSGYGLADGDLAMVICLRHLATVFAFTDPIWAKHGKQMASMVRYESRDGQPPLVNPHNSAPRAALDTLAKRGVQFIVCDMATNRFSRALAGSDGNAAAVYKEVASNMIPSSRLVAAGVVGVTRAQEYGYSMLFVG